LITNGLLVINLTSSKLTKSLRMTGKKVRSVQKIRMQGRRAVSVFFSTEL